MNAFSFNGISTLGTPSLCFGVGTWFISPSFLGPPWDHAGHASIYRVLGSPNLKRVFACLQRTHAQDSERHRGSGNRTALCESEFFNTEVANLYSVEDLENAQSKATKIQCLKMP